MHLFRFLGRRLGPNQMPVSQLKAFRKLCPQEAFGAFCAVGEVLELGPVSGSSAELPVTAADLAGPSRPQIETLCCLLALAVVWCGESDSTVKTESYPQHMKPQS